MNFMQFIMSNRTSLKPYLNRMCCGAQFDNQTVKFNTDVKSGLDLLNQTCTAINRLEVDLDDSRRIYQLELSEFSSKIYKLYHKSKDSIEKCRPYFDLLSKHAELLNEAKQLSEKYLEVKNINDEACQTLNNFTIRADESEEGIEILRSYNAVLHKVNYAKSELRQIQRIHGSKLEECRICQEQLRSLESRLSFKIKKSRPYFELQVQLSKRLHDAKARVDSCTEKLAVFKNLYASTMKKLELLSNSVHESRRSCKLCRSTSDLSGEVVALGKRSCGVGADSTYSSLVTSSASYPETNLTLVSLKVKRSASVSFFYHLPLESESIESSDDSQRRTPLGHLDTSEKFEHGRFTPFAHEPAVNKKHSSNIRLSFNSSTMPLIEGVMEAMRKYHSETNSPVFIPVARSLS